MAASALGAAVLVDTLLEMGYDAEAGVLTAMTSTELADDWASEASGESHRQRN